MKSFVFTRRITGRQRVSRLLLLSLLFACLCAGVPLCAQDGSEKPKQSAVIWHDPGDIRSRDLFYGPGGKAGQPQPPFRFQEEHSRGHNPKFDVMDGNGTKWVVKVGPEARPEVVATRLLWAVGFFTNINYFTDVLQVEGMPAQLSRGGEFVDKKGEVFQARLQKKPSKDAKPWKWRKNPFLGTREFNGLRVMMALLRNWDLKNDNNAYYVDSKTGTTIYYVTDVGSTFGHTGKSYYGDTQAKSNLEAFRHSKFIAKVHGDRVDFNLMTFPPFYQVLVFPVFIRQLRMRWIGHDIPLQDARWIGTLLSQLSDEQLQDAFRAGGYTPEQIAAFTAVLRERITQLTMLGSGLAQRRNPLPH